MSDTCPFERTATANMLRRVRRHARGDKTVLVVAAYQRDVDHMRCWLDAKGVNLALLTFTTPQSLHMVEGLHVDRVEIDDYARIVARRAHLHNELSYLENTVTM